MIIDASKVLDPQNPDRGSGPGLSATSRSRAHDARSGPINPMKSASLTTSTYLAWRSNRFASCGPGARSPQASRMTNGAKPCWIASNALARTQPEVEKPVMPSVSMRSAVSVAARLVPKKAEAYCFVTTI